MTATQKTARRNEFLTDVFVTAIENYGYGWFETLEYEPDEGTALIRESETGKEFAVTLDILATGFSVIRRATLAILSGEEVRVNDMGEPLFFGGEPRRQLLLADRTNGEDGDFDVIGALAVLECALFGRVVYG